MAFTCVIYLCTCTYVTGQWSASPDDVTVRCSEGWNRFHFLAGWPCIILPDPSPFAPPLHQPSRLNQINKGAAFLFFPSSAVVCQFQVLSSLVLSRSFQFIQFCRGRNNMLLWDSRCSCCCCCCRQWLLITDGDYKWWLDYRQWQQTSCAIRWHIQSDDNNLSIWLCYTVTTEVSIPLTSPVVFGRWIYMIFTMWSLPKNVHTWLFCL